jgi:hypothetical protein
LENFKTGLKHARHPRQMRIDFTLTLPGLTEVLAVQQLAQELQVELLAKTVFSFTPDIVMSPLALPRILLEHTVNELLASSNNPTMIALLHQLLARPTFEEQWPDTYKDALAHGKRRVLQLESIRPCSTNMETILQQWPDILNWWHKID